MRKLSSASIVVLILGLTVVLMACAPAAPTPAPPTPAPKPAATVAAPAPPTPAPKAAAPAAAPAAPTSVVPAKLEKVKLAVFRRGGGFAPWYFARDKGFYKAVGLDVEIAEAAGMLHNPGLISGEIDYTAIAVTSEVFTPIITKGLPNRVLTVTYARPSWYLIGGPGVTTVNDLKGKAVNASGIGSVTHMGVMAALKDKGMDPDKDVTYVPISPADRVAALASGAIAASFMGSPDHFVAEQKYGYKVLVDLGPIVDIPMNGLGSSERKIKENAAQVKAMIRGTLRGFRSYRDNPQESIQYLMKEFDYSAEVAKVLYDDQMRVLSFDGIITDEMAQRVFDFEVAVGNIPADLVGKVQPQTGIDMRLLQEVLKEGL